MNRRPKIDSYILFAGLTVGAVGIWLIINISIAALVVVSVIGAVGLYLGILRAYHDSVAWIAERRAIAEKRIRDCSTSTVHVGAHTFFSDTSGRAWVNPALNQATHFTAYGSLSSDEAENQRWALLNGYVPHQERQVEPGRYPERPVQIAGPGPSSLPDLLSAISAMDRVLIIGGMGAGKSELLRHLAASTRGRVKIVDSHAAPDPWPEGIPVIGRGRDYPAIKQEFAGIMAEMDSRYHQRATGERVTFEALTLIIDEFSVLNQFCDLGDTVKALLCECRKVNIRLIIAGQSDRVKALGIQGAGDLKESFDAVVYLKKDASGYHGLIDGDRFAHPGIFQGRERPFRERSGSLQMTGTAVPGGVPRVTAVPLERSRNEMERIAELHDDGKSLSQIAFEIFGSKGRNVKKIKAVLRSAGRL